MGVDQHQIDAFLPSGEAIFRAGVAGVLPDRLLEQSVIRRTGSPDAENTIVIQGKTFNLAVYERVYLAAFGKAAPRMAETLARILGDNLTRGVVVSSEAGAGRIGPLEYIKGSHPLPDDGSVEGARRILEMASGAGEKDLFFICISGGGSALLCLPVEGISLEEKRRVTHALLNAGATINELNAVRKHLSAIKGGRLAQAAFPAAVVNLVISDVLDNELETIASGPSHWDPTTFRDARIVLEKYHLWEKIPMSVRDHIGRGVQGGAAETIKETDPIFESLHTFVVGDNTAALRAAEEEAQRLGFETLVLTSSDRGEARKAAANYVSFLASMACGAASQKKPLCFLAGGELTVSVTGSGVGGRNTEFVLAAALEAGKGDLADIFCAGRRWDRSPREVEIEGLRPLEWLILSAGTDGIDGPTDAAGAWIGPAALGRILELGLDPQRSLGDNDSYTFFKKTGNLIVTGPSGTNVMDIRIFLLGPIHHAL